MYNYYFPKEALELYLILKLDKSNNITQDIFYLLYHLASQNEKEIYNIAHNIRKILTENASIYNIENLFLTSQNFKLQEIYSNSHISKNLKNHDFTNLYTSSYNEIAKAYLNFDLNILVNIFNAKQEIYQILEKVSTNNIDKKIFREKFYNLLNTINNYIEKEELDKYYTYFESCNYKITRFFGKYFKYNQLNQLDYLENRTKNTDFLQEKNFEDIEIPFKEKIKIIKSFIIPIIEGILLMAISNFIFVKLPANSDSYIIKTSYNITNCLILIYLLSNIIRILTIVFKKKLKVVKGFICKKIISKDSKRYYIYIPNFNLITYNRRYVFGEPKNIKYFILPYYSNLQEMDSVILIKLYNKYICSPIDN